MKKSIALVVGAAVVVMSGCQSKPVDVTGREQQQMGIGINDFIDAANLMVDDLLQSGKLERLPNQPAIMVVDRIVDNTSVLDLDMDSLLHGIRKRLSDSDKVLVNEGYIHDGQLIDNLSDIESIRSGSVKPKRVDVILRGKIIESRSQVGRQREKTYDFQLVMTSMDGIVLWEGRYIVSKGEVRPLI